MKYILYCTQNNINKKIYVGVHKTFTPNKFDGYLGCGVYTNGTGVRDKTTFHKAIKKYGIDNFTRIVLATFDSEYDAYEAEGLLVNKQFVVRKDTYNMIVGGKFKLYKGQVACYDLTGKLLTTYDDINAGAKAVKVLSIYINKACLTPSLTCNGYYWRGFNNNPKEQIVLTNNSKEVQQGARKAIPVVQYSLSGYKMKTWTSAKEAAFHLHCDRATITAACRGRKKTLKKYQWRYKSDNLESLPKIITSGGKSRTIIQLDSEGRLIEDYSSVTVAAEITNLSRVSVHKGLKTGKKVGGFFWKYV